MMFGAGTTGAGAAMSLAVEIKRRGAAAVAPLVFLSLVAYFLWQAQQGDRGLASAAQRQEDLRLARLDLARAEDELALWQRRVQALRDNPIDRDALDERVRAMLNLSHPNDIIFPYAQNQRLF